MNSPELRDKEFSFKLYHFPDTEEKIGCIKQDETTKLFSSYMFIMHRKQDYYRVIRADIEDKKEFSLSFVISMNTFGIIVDKNVPYISNILGYCCNDINIGAKKYFAFKYGFSFAMFESLRCSIDRSHMFSFDKQYTKNLLINMCDFSIEYPEYYQKYTAIVGMGLFYYMDVLIYNYKFYFTISQEDITSSQHGILDGILKKYFPSNRDCMERDIAFKKENEYRKKNGNKIYYNKVNIIQLKSVETKMDYAVEGRIESYINNSYYLEGCWLKINYWFKELKYIDGILLDSLFTGGIRLPDLIDINDGFRKLIGKPKYDKKEGDINSLERRKILEKDIVSNDRYQIKSVIVDYKYLLFTSRFFLDHDIHFDIMASHIDGAHKKTMPRMGLKCFGGCGFANIGNIDHCAGEDINCIFFKCGHNSNQSAFLFAFMQNEKPMFILDNTDPIEVVSNRKPRLAYLTARQTCPQPTVKMDISA